jgi:hypothetical protein
MLQLGKTDTSSCWTNGEEIPRCKVLAFGSVIALVWVSLLLLVTGCGGGGFPALTGVQVEGTGKLALTFETPEGATYVQRTEFAELYLPTKEEGKEMLCTVVQELSINGLVLAAGAIEAVSDVECFEEAGGPFRPFLLGPQRRQELPRDGSGVAPGGGASSQDSGGGAADVPVS